jgi:hypothetical protein
LAAPKQTTIDDVFKQISRLIGTAHALMERFARGYEEIDSIKLALEEQRELLADHFSENSRWADKLSDRMDRIEQYTVLGRFGNTSATLQIEAVVSKEHIERSLREELVTQRELWSVYQKNLDRLRLQIAKFGDTVARLNEIDDYEHKLIAIEEKIEYIREQLAKLETK